MAIRKKPDGSIEADTPDELHAFLRIAEPVSMPAQPLKRTESPAIRQQPERDYAGFVASLADRDQYKLLGLVLKASPTGLTDDAARIEMHVTSNVALRGMLIGIARRAKAFHLPTIINRDITRMAGGKKRTYRYYMTNAVAKAIKEQLNME